MQNLWNVELDLNISCQQRHQAVTGAAEKQLPSALNYSKLIPERKIILYTNSFLADKQGDHVRHQVLLQLDPECPGHVQLRGIRQPAQSGS